MRSEQNMLLKTLQGLTNVIFLIGIADKSCPNHHVFNDTLFLRKMCICEKHRCYFLIFLN